MKRFVRKEKSEIERTYSENERVSESENWSFGFAKKRR